MSGFVVGYVGPDGRELREDLGVVAGVAFELVPPVRSFPAYRGQRNNTGLWWSATIGGHVGFESWLERDHLTLLDFDPSVVAMASQPFWLSWDQAGRRRSHAPDFFVRLVDGTGVVIDVRPAGRVRPRDAAAFETTGRACAEVGWEYRLLHEPDPVVMANVRWLAGYRHPRCLRPAVAAAAPAMFAEPTPLMDGATRLGDPLASLPAVFHLLWCGRLSTDLTVPLSELSIVSAAGR
ncbi:TnsA-like heteromeric transposase endonuclease subunit [Micromonospora sp. WMMD1102]|uniref:TnsA-like heteromeric transposase endonuclease subunit n=1 Tax=Micromonospora sp. WMMD1102 TaxID=3016105 RepID=UPI002415377D|nr:TnsA-like heteromeric transposase endonuclease subunit [Micromonospora sp. WMMD1102]MDG4786231.1 TnsA-like heteromeric transposase endonuclease subunit [Micromonospora sp. WMMD1102]